VLAGLPARQLRRVHVGLGVKRGQHAFPPVAVAIGRDLAGDVAADQAAAVQARSVRGMVETEHALIPVGARHARANTSLSMDGRPRTGLPLSRDERASTRRHRGRVEGMAQPARTAQRVSVPMLQ
jgi:hypothetical protein